MKPEPPRGRPLRVAHVTSELCRQSAGLSVAVAGISGSIDNNFFESKVFGLSSENWQNGDADNWSGAPAETFNKNALSGQFGFAPGLFDRLKSYAPDVVHLHGLWTYPSLAVLRWHKATRRPFVVSAHGMLTPVALKYGRHKKRLAMWLFQRRLLQSASVLHATSSEEVENYQILHLPGEVQMIPLGVDIPPVINRVHSTKRNVIFLGRLHHKKGLDILIQAWMNLEKDFPDWVLSIAGPTEISFAPELVNLRSKARNSRVKFRNALYGHEKHDLLTGAELFVLPSRSENFGLAVAESLGMEIPVITTTGTPWKILQKYDAGWWVPPEIGTVENALREAMSLPKESLQRKGQNGRKLIEERFSWGTIGLSFEKLYRFIEEN